MGDGSVVSGSVDSGCHKKMYGLYGLKHHIVEISQDVTDGRTNNKQRWSYSAFDL